MRNLCEKHTCARVAPHILQFVVTLIKITMQIRRNQAKRRAREPERRVGEVTKDQVPARGSAEELGDGR